MMSAKKKSSGPWSLAHISARTHGVDHWRKTSATSVLHRSSCSTVSLVLRTSSAQLEASGAGRCEERIFTPSVMKWRQEVTVWWVGTRRPPRWRTCWYRRSTPGPKRPTTHEVRYRQGTARAVRCIIYAQSLQVSLPNPAVCHCTLRLPLRGVTVTYRDPT